MDPSDMSLKSIVGLWLSGMVVVSALGVAAAAPPIAPDEGRPHVAWQDAEQVIGKVAFVSGEVVRVRTAGRVTILDFEDARPPRFSAVVYADNLANFPGALEKLYEGKLVWVRGLVETYAGKPQIKLAGPQQIEVLTELPATQPPARPVKTAGAELTIATYNVLNLFDDVDDPYHTDEGTPGKPREELERVAQVLRKIDADVVALEEVENRWYLERFLEVFLPEMGYEVVLFEGNDLRGIDVCLLSRVPVGVVHSYRHLRFPDANGKTRRFARDVVAVELRPDGAAPLEVWVLHLKSNYGGREYAEPVRLGEAQQIRRMLDERFRLNPKARIVVLGDFNDTWESASTQALVGSGPFALRCFAESLPEGQRVTYNREPHLSMIDFVLCSPALAEGYVKDSYRVWPGSVDSQGSDHNPVAARFRVK